MDSSQPGPSQPRAEEEGPSLASLLDQGGFCVYPLPWCPHLELLPDTWPDTVKWVQVSSLASNLTNLLFVAVCGRSAGSALMPPRIGCVSPATRSCAAGQLIFLVFPGDSIE